MVELNERLGRIAPPRFSEGCTLEQFLQSLEETTPVVKDFARLADAVSGMSDVDAAGLVYRGFAPILEKYDNPRGFTLTFDRRDFDYWKVLGHEFLVTFVGIVLRDQRFDVNTCFVPPSFQPQDESRNNSARDAWAHDVS